MRSKAGGDRLSFVEFQLPTLVADPPDGDGWLHEIKYDGYRTQLIIAGGHARAFTRNDHDWSAKYQPIVEAAGALPLRSAIIDGVAAVCQRIREMRRYIARQNHQRVSDVDNLLAVACSNCEQTLQTGKIHPAP